MTWARTRSSSWTWSASFRVESTGGPVMISHIDEPIVSRRARHLKWRALDPLEYGLMVLCGLLLLGFTLSELGDVAFRLMNRPWLSAQEFSIAFFVWGV